jgi:hypothetical protein
MGIACHSVDNGTHKYIYRQEFHVRMGHSALTRLMSFNNLEGLTAFGFSVCKSTTLLLSTAKAGSITMLMLFHNDPARRSVPTATDLRHGQT